MFSEKGLEELIKKIKERAEVEIRLLTDSVKKLIETFGNGESVSSRAKVIVSNTTNGSTEIMERIYIHETANGLFRLEIIRNHYVSKQITKDVSADSYIDITLYWNDCSDSLTYKADNYPSMSNEDVVEEVKALIKAAELIISNTWKK